PKRAARSITWRIDAHHGPRGRSNVARRRHACAHVDTPAGQRPELCALLCARKSWCNRDTQRECIREELTAGAHIAACSAGNSGLHSIRTFCALDERPACVAARIFIGEDQRTFRRCPCVLIVLPCTAPPSPSR